eukprot:5446427-Pyramimonas_sp.AAC.1
MHPRALLQRTHIAPRSAPMQDMGTAARRAHTRNSSVSLTRIGDVPSAVDALRAQHVDGNRAPVGGVAIRVADDGHLRPPQRENLVGDLLKRCSPIWR